MEAGVYLIDNMLAKDRDAKERKVERLARVAANIVKAHADGQPRTFFERLKSCRAKRTKPYLDAEQYLDAPADDRAIRDAAEEFRCKVLELMEGQRGFDVADLRMGARHGYDPKHGKHKMSFRGWLPTFAVDYTKMPDLIRARGLGQYFDCGVYKPTEQLMGMMFCAKGKILLSNKDVAWDGRVLTPLQDAPYEDYVIGKVRDDARDIVVPTLSYLCLASLSTDTASIDSDTLGAVAICPARPAPATVPAVSSCQDDIIPLLHLIDKHAWDDRRNWITIATALKNHSGNKYYDEWIKLSRLSPKFDETDAKKTWESLGREDFQGRRVTIATIHALAKAHDPIGYRQYRVARVPAVVTNNWDKGDIGLADICALFRDAVKKVGREEYYMFDEEKCVWRASTRDMVRGYLSKRLEEVLREVEIALGLEVSAMEDDDPGKAALDERRKEIPRIIKYVRGNRGLNNVMSLASDKFLEPGFVNELDRVPHLLGVSGGVIDLRTGIKRACTPEDKISRQLDVDYDIDTDVSWIDGIVLKAMAGDQEMMEYVQKLLGYAITGDVSEEIFVVWTGNGRNCKGLLTQTIQGVLGDFYREMNCAIISDGRKAANLDAERAKLQGARLAMFNELKPGEKLKTNEVQLLSGGDGIPACAKYCDPITIEPRHMCLLSTNYMPEVSEVIAAMIERLICVEFPVYFTDLAEGEEETPLRRQKDRSLKPRLRTPEGRSAFLRWCVIGATKWYEDGGGLKSRAPEKVKGFTKKYLEDQDVVTKFIAERCDVGEGKKVRSVELFEAFCHSHEERVSDKWFSTQMKRRGFEKKGSVRFEEGVLKGYLGIALKDMVL